MKANKKKMAVGLSVLDGSIRNEHRDDPGIGRG